MRFPIGLLFLASLVLHAQIAAPPAASNVEWTGKFVGDNLEFELRQTPLGGLTGTLLFDGKTYLATGRANGNVLSGNFRTESGSFAYEATLNGAQLEFSTGGTAYLLRRVAGATGGSNPLSRTRPAPGVFGSATSQPASPVQPASGTLFKHGLGYSLRLPSGWTATENPEGATLLPAGVTFNPARQDNPEIYIAVMRDGYNPQEEAQIVAQFSAAVARNGASGGRNGQRESASFGQRNGSIYRWDVRDPNTGRLAAFDVFLAPEGQRAFVLVAAGEQPRVRARDTELRQILASMAATPLQSSAGGPLADNTALAQRWYAKLRGKHVRQFWASQGMSSDKRHILGADGSYAFRSSSMVSVDVSGASALSTGGDNSRGRWRIRDIGGQVFLEVQYVNGNVSRMPITENGQNWFLNGEKAFAVDPE